MNATVQQGARLRQRFRVLPYTNPRTGSLSWRVYGIKRDGTMIRENHPDPEAARQRHLQLEAEFHNTDTTQRTGLRATRLSDDALRVAETALARLDRTEDLLVAVDYWIRHGRKEQVSESPRLDDACTQFLEWLVTTPTLREASKQALRWRVRMFANRTENLRVADIRPETVEKFIEAQDVSPRAKINFKRAISRFMAWCLERPRRWANANPCAVVKIEIRNDAPPPAILSVEQCKTLLETAETHKDGALVPYVALCLFAGLRPTEARRLTWEAINLKDGEIRLEATASKTKRPRVVTIHATLKRWLSAYRDRDILPTNWLRMFQGLIAEADLRPWQLDIMRHTAISHYFRSCGSYGRTAEQFGNSEKIIKDHYQGRVSTQDTKEFYAIQPAKGGVR